MNVLAELEDILDKERQLILAARFNDLERLSTRKSLLSGRIGQVVKADLGHIERLRASAVRNDALLQSAARGLKSALQQISDARSLKDQTTYTADGSRNPIAPRRGKLLQRL